MHAEQPNSVLRPIAVGVVIAIIGVALALVAPHAPPYASGGPRDSTDNPLLAIRLTPDPPMPDVPIRVDIDLAPYPTSDSGCYGVSVAWVGFFSDGPGGNPAVETEAVETTRGGGDGPVPRWTPGGVGGVSGNLSGHCSTTVGSFDDGTVLWIAASLTSLSRGPLGHAEVAVSIGHVIWADPSGPTIEEFEAGWRGGGLAVDAVVTGDASIAVADFGMAEFSSGCGGLGIETFDRIGSAGYSLWFPAPICSDHEYHHPSPAKLVLARGAFRDAAGRTAVTDTLLIHA